MSTEQKVTDNKNKGMYLAALVVFCITIMTTLCACSPSEQNTTSEPQIRDRFFFVVTANHADGSIVSEDEMTTAVNVLTNRMNTFGDSRATVQREGDNQISIRTPVAISETGRATLVGAGKVEFVDLRAVYDAEAVANIKAGQIGTMLERGTYAAFMTGDSITSASVSGSAGTVLELDSLGKSAYAAVTSELAPENGLIVILIDGVVKKTLLVTSPVTDGKLVIPVQHSFDEADVWEKMLDANSLPEGLSLSISSSDE